MRDAKVGVQPQELRRGLPGLGLSSARNGVYDKCAKRMRVRRKLDRFARRRTPLVVAMQLKQRE